MNTGPMYPRLLTTLALACLAIALGRPAAALEANADLPKDVTDAVRSLGKADDAGRQKVYDLIAKEGDARLIPALRAFVDGRLQDRDGTLVIYSDTVQLPGKDPAMPLIDAFTGQPLKEPDGSPTYVFGRINLSAPGMMRLPPAKRQERVIIADLTSVLSLLDPDPKVRIQSVRDTGERAGRVFVDPTDEVKVAGDLKAGAAALKAAAAGAPASDPASDPLAAAAKDAVAAIDAALAERPTKLLGAVPSKAALSKVTASLNKVQAELTGPAAATRPAIAALKGLGDTLTATLAGARMYQNRVDDQKKKLDELPKYAVAIKRQLDKEPNSQFTGPLKEATASFNAVIGDRPAQIAAVKELGDIGTSRAANILRRLATAAKRTGDDELAKAVVPALEKAETYQTRIHFVQHTFAGLSLGSILVLLALGLSIIFGLMGVINMAHGEFMMVGAFTTYVVHTWFKAHAPGLFEYYLLAAIPAAFLVAGGVGLLVENVVIRHLYGRPLETLLATWGVGLILIQVARVMFGDTLSVTPPKWMEGGIEVMPDLVFPRNRVFIIAFCAVCIFTVYYLVNRTKLGLLLRATTQNREMAAALGVPTRRVDALTFALGAGLAGLAGVAVPLYNKINPSIGQEYIVDSFMVVVVGGVGKLAGAIYAGLGLGFISKYLEPFLQYFKAMESSSSVVGKVLVLGMIVMFLQWRPSGIFPPKGRLADA